MKIQYDTVQLTQAVRFIWDRNPSIKKKFINTNEVEEDILGLMKLYGPSVSNIASMGIVVIFNQDEHDGSIEAEIYVDPCIGLNSNLVFLDCP